MNSQAKLLLTPMLVGFTVAAIAGCSVRDDSSTSPAVGTDSGNVPALYAELAESLGAGEWKKADLRTSQLMLKVVGREQEGWIEESDMNKFPCEVLSTIDQLWGQYSNGRFGFSPQITVYRSLKKENIDNMGKSFGDRVGWRNEIKTTSEPLRQGWLHYQELTFSIDAPSGHLPTTIISGESWVDGRSNYDVPIIGTGIWGVKPEYANSLDNLTQGSLESLFSRVDTCGL